MKPRIQIIRGLPGSGKSTLAVNRYPHLMRVETDMFFTTGGEYVFTLERNRRAVQWFLNTVADLCRQGMDFVVTGVFAAHTERLDKVVETALAHGYSVFIQTQTADYGNIHGVPQAHLDAMRRDFASDEELAKRYGTKVIFGLMSEKLKLGEAEQ